MGLCLIEDKLKSLPPELLYHLHKGIGRERVMLRRDTEALLLRLVQDEPVLQKAHLLDHLSRIAQKFHAFFCQSDAAAAPREYIESDFPFCFLHSR